MNIAVILVQSSFLPKEKDLEKPTDDTLTCTVHPTVNVFVQLQCR